MRILVPFLFAIILLFTGSTPSKPGVRMFEVRVEAKINSCLSHHDVTVEARSMQEAREKARRVVQTKLITRAMRVSPIQ